LFVGWDWLIATVPPLRGDKGVAAAVGMTEFFEQGRAARLGRRALLVIRG
jgi:hypothetical protein